VNRVQALFLRTAYVGLLLLATLAPFQFQFEVSAALTRLSRAFSPAYSPADFVDAVRNVALFAGWGALWTITAPPGRIRQVVWPPIWSGLVLSVAIELTQSLTPRRTSSILDVATNGLGSLAGSLLIVGLVALVRALRNEKSHVGIPGVLFAGAYLTALVFEAVFAPFRLSPIPGLYGGPLARMAGTLAHFEWRSLYEVPFRDIFLFLPAGALAVVALVELGKSHRSAARLTMVAGTVLWLATELFHGFLALPIQLGPLVVHAASTALGAWLAARFLPSLSRTLRGRLRPRYLLLLYGAVLLVWAWRPGRVTEHIDAEMQLSWRRLIPLQGSAPRLDLYSVADLAEGFLLYFPVGCLLAVWPVRRRGWLAAYLPGVLIAVVGEIGQPLIAGRYFDVTDILVEAAGMGMGWAIVRRAGFSAYGEMVPASPERGALR
jgi:glycopeptide antibiotics resistance protein